MRLRNIVIVAAVFILGMAIVREAGASEVYMLANNGGANQVWEYSGSGTSWSPITGTNTRVSEIAAAGAQLFQIATNGGPLRFGNTMDPARIGLPSPERTLRSRASLAIAILKAALGNCSLSTRTVGPTSCGNMTEARCTGRRSRARICRSRYWPRPPVYHTWWGRMAVPTNSGGTAD
jgi:hypothetical protein